MPVETNFSVDDIGVRIQADVDKKNKALIKMLQYVGERCVIEAREGGSYTDQTGNLRSSIGYAVLCDGRVIRKGYSGISSGGKDGELVGKSFLNKKAKEVTDRGLVLIVTAGMNYAEYVEAKNYNVLSSSQLLAEDLVRNLLTKLGFKIV